MADDHQSQIAELQERLDNLQAKNARLSKREQMLHDTLEAMPVGILAVDAEGRVIYSNRRFSKMWRIPPDLIETGDDNEMLNYVRGQLVDPQQFLSRVKELYGSLREECDTLEFRDGRKFLRHSGPLVHGDQIRGRVWCFHNVTDSEKDA